MSQAVKQHLTRIAKRLSNWLSSKVYYIAANGQCYHWQQQQLLPLNAANQQPKPQIPKPQIVVLSRFAYEEQKQSYPISSRAALRKILQQQQGSQLAYHYIGDEHQGQRTVLTITPKVAVLNLCQQAKVVLPISLLVKASGQLGLHTVQLPDGCFYQLNAPAAQFNSVPASQLTASANQALNILGGHTQSAQYSWQPHDFITLCKNAAKLPLAYWRTAYTGTKSTFNLTQALPFISLSAVLASLYLLATSYWLTTQITSQQALLQQQHSAITPVLAARSTLQRAQAQRERVQQHAAQTYTGTLLWELYALAQLHEVQVTSIEANTETIQLSGQSANAISWLQQLLAQPFVRNAEFTTPVRRLNNNQEQYDITLQLAAVITPISEGAAHASQ